MQIEIQARGFALTQSLAAHIELRVLRSLNNVRYGIKRIAVRVSDEKRSRYGNGKRCMIRIALRGHREIVVKDVRGDIYHAITNASFRALNATKKLLGRHESEHQFYSEMLLKAGKAS